MSTTLSVSPPRASLLGLPAELRLQIYEHIFTKLQHPKWAFIHIDEQHAWDMMTFSNAYNSRRGQQPSASSILQTCQLIRDEASEVLYREADVSVCILPAFYRPPRGSTFGLGPAYYEHLCLGLPAQVGVWRFFRNLQLVVEIEKRDDLQVYIDRVTAFLKLIAFGRHLRKLALVVLLREETAEPVYKERLLDALTALDVGGELTVRLDGDVKDEEERVWRMLTSTVVPRYAV